eukprot:2627_1
MNGTKDINNLGVFSRDFSKKYAKELDELRAKQQRLFIDFSKDLLQIDTDDAALVEEAIKDRIWVCCDCCSYEWAFDEAITECEVCGHSNTSNLADPIQIEPNLLQLLDDCISRQDVVPVTVFSDEEEPDSLESLYEMLDIWIDAVQCRH